MLKSITLLGSSSGRNAGDAALMSSIMDAVDAACGTELLYEIPTIKPAFVRDNYSTRVKPIGILPWNLSVKMMGLPTYRSVMRTDLTIIFDAILFDRALYNPLFNFLHTLHLLLPLARKRGKKMVFFNVGAGPVNTAAGKRMLRDLGDMMDFITVRDKASFDILKDIGVANKRLIIAADSALCAKPSSDEAVDRILSKLGMAGEKEILGLNVNTYLNTWAKANVDPLTREQFVETYASAVSKVLEKINVPVLLVATQHQDVGLSKEIMSRIVSNNKVAVVSNVENSHYDIKGVLGRVSLLYGMRLHSMILAASELTPVAGLAYQPKVDYFFEMLGLPEQSLSFDCFSDTKVAEHMLQAWEKRNVLRDRLEKRIPELQKKTNIAADLAGCMYRGEDLDKAISLSFDENSHALT